MDIICCIFTFKQLLLSTFLTSLAVLSDVAVPGRLHIAGSDVHSLLPDNVDRLLYYAEVVHVSYACANHWCLTDKTDMVFHRHSYKRWYFNGLSVGFLLMMSSTHMSEIHLSYLYSLRLY